MKHADTWKQLIFLYSNKIVFNFNLNLESNGEQKTEQEQLEQEPTTEHWMTSVEQLHIPANHQWDNVHLSDLESDFSV